MAEPMKVPAPDAADDEWGYFAMQIPGWREPAESLPSSWLTYSHRIVPNPDHWAWEGWFLRLLGSGCPIWQDREDGLWTVEIGGVRAFTHASLGRACIAAAAAIGRWPGGDLWLSR